MNTLLLIDGNSLLRRAFHTPAYEKLSYQDKPTGAVYGFFSMLSKLISEIRPNSMAIAFDENHQCFRNYLYPDYKANRPPTPEAFVPQKDYTRQCLDAFGIRHFSVANYEADDIIATLAQHFNNGSNLINIVTADRDLLQTTRLPHTIVMLTKKGVSEIESWTLGNVRARLGLDANQIPDYKALVGDLSDNVPGAPGVGTKTAVKLLKEYGSLANILQAAPGQKGKAWNGIRASADKLPLYEKIVHLVYDVPLEIGTLTLNLNLEQGMAVLREYGIINIRFHQPTYGQPSLTEVRNIC